MRELIQFKILGKNSLRIIEEINRRNYFTEGNLLMYEFSVKVIPMLMYGDSEYVLQLREVIPVEYRDGFQECMSQQIFNDHKQNIEHAINGSYFLGTKWTSKSFLPSLIANIRASMDVMFPGWTEKYGHIPPSE